MHRGIITLLFSSALLAQDTTPQDPKARARMAREWGRQGSEAIPRLAALLSDPVLDVRLEAVKSIVEIGTQHSLEPCIRATRDPDEEIQIRATDGLVNFYVPGYVRTGLTSSIRRAGTSIKGKFTDVNDQVVDSFVDVRPDVIEALGKLARGGITMQARANAARAVGILRGRAAVGDLAEALRSKDDQLIYESLVALQKIGDPEAAPRIAFLLRDPVEKVQIAAIETVGLLRNKEALPRLKQVLADSRSAKVRRAALVAIAMLPDESSRKTYAQYFQDSDESLRAAAAEGYGRLASASDRPMMDKAFADERKMSPRLAQAFALAMVGRTEVSEFSPLQYLINTLNQRMYRGVAVAYLIELARTPQVRSSLHAALSGGTRDEKSGIADILARSGDRDSIAPLEKLTKDADADVAAAGLRALRTLKARLR